MTFDLFFVAGSFVMGVIQVVEAGVLLRHAGALRGSVALSSTIEFLWTIFCVYLLVAGRLESSRWLAIMFLLYIAVATVVGLMTARLLRNSPETMRVPKVLAYLDGIFGALYAGAALILLAR